MPSGQRHHPHGLHDGDGAQVGIVLGRQRHHLRQRAGARAEQRRLRVPAMHEAQIGRGRGDHAAASKPPAPAMLSGKVARPLSVSGVTTAPSEMPTRTEITRDSGTGTCIGRPNSAAGATASSEPVTSPAGKPSAVRTHPAGRGDRQRLGRAQPFGFRWNRRGRHRPRSMPRPDLGQRRQTPHVGLMPCRSASTIRTRSAALLAQLVHDTGTMHLDGARADAERAAGLLVGVAGDDHAPAPRARAGSAVRLP